MRENPFFLPNISSDMSESTEKSTMENWNINLFFLPITFAHAFDRIFISFFYSAAWMRVVKWKEGKKPMKWKFSVIESDYNPSTILHVPISHRFTYFPLIHNFKSLLYHFSLPYISLSVTLTHFLPFDIYLTLATLSRYVEILVMYCGNWINWIWKLILIKLWSGSFYVKRASYS